MHSTFPTYRHESSRICETLVWSEHGYQCFPALTECFAALMEYWIKDHSTLDIFTRNVVHLQQIRGNLDSIACHEAYVNTVLDQFTAKEIPTNIRKSGDSDAFHVCWPLLAPSFFNGMTFWGISPVCTLTFKSSTHLQQHEIMCFPAVCILACIMSSCHKKKYCAVPQWMALNSSMGPMRNIYANITGDLRFSSWMDDWANLHYKVLLIHNTFSSMTCCPSTHVDPYLHWLHTSSTAWLSGAFQWCGPLLSHFTHVFNNVTS